MDSSPLIEQIEDMNDQLEDEVTELEHQVKQLKEYRNDMAIESKSNPIEEQPVKTAFESLVYLTTNGLMQSGMHIQSSSMDHIHIPWTVNVSPIDIVHCLGCGQAFNRLLSSEEVAYYIHCIEECSKYKDLNLIRECVACQKKFINNASMMGHVCQRPPKPDWMVPSMYAKGFRIGNNHKKCPGCGKQFPVASHDRYSFNYLVHMIENCSAYRDLNLITECHECHYKFPNQALCFEHVTRNHSMPKPKWMTRECFKKGNNASRLKTKPVPCHGCGKELRKVLGLRPVYRFKDYVHMIEQCPQYKKLNLIKTCDKCDCKFINPIAFSKHKC